MEVLGNGKRKVILGVIPTGVGSVRLRGENHGICDAARRAQVECELPARTAYGKLDKKAEKYLCACGEGVQLEKKWLHHRKHL